MELRGVPVPVCRTHVEKIVDCHPCRVRLTGYWKTMAKAGIRVFPGMTGRDFNQLVDRAADENQERLHSWAVAHLYKNPNELGEEPF